MQAGCLRSFLTDEAGNRQLGVARREARDLPDGLRRDATATFAELRAVPLHRIGLADRSFRPSYLGCIAFAHGLA